MGRIDLESLIIATEGRPVGLPSAAIGLGEVRVDSRQVIPGDVFWALSGTTTDGHHFVNDAVRRGAAFCVVQDGRCEVPGPHLVVPDTLQALGRFAASRRRSVDAMVIGVTGSNGKTTTRSMLYSVLSTRFQGHQSPASFNNHVGVPLSLLGLNSDHEFAVIELGASRVGEIAALSRIAQPEVAVITSVAPAHLAGFGSIENVVQTKGELVEAVPAGGFVVLNGDDERVKTMSSRASCRVIHVGERLDNEIHAERIQVTNERLDLVVNGSPFSVRAIGRHHATAALLAIAVGREVGLTDREIALGLARFEAVEGRCRQLNVGEWTIIDDTYNANPGSMAAACHVLRDWAGGHHKWLVVGDMLALGSASPVYHSQLGAQAAAAGIHGLAAIGEFSEFVVDEAARQGMDRGCLGAFRDFRLLISMLECWLEPGDVVLVKGSRAMRMEQVVEGLQQLAPRTSQPTPLRRAA